MPVRCPKWQDVERFFKDPELLTAEILFLILTLCNVFVMFRLFSDVTPFPVFVTWWQLLQGLFMAWTLGDFGKEFPKFAYFPLVQVDKQLMKGLLVPTIVYVTMLVLVNIVLSKTPCIATFPVVVSFTVVLHHVTRFVGCGEEYMPMRWYSVGTLFIAFLLGCTDPQTVGILVLPWALLYAVASAGFRACYLQKVVHIVEGRGNSLHNHQHILGIALLPIAWGALGEWKIFTYMPCNFGSLHTWQMWGCLLTVGALPFVKNIVSNRLIRRTGQGPWRALEIASIFLVFTIGLSFGAPGWQGFLATLLVIVGRTVGMYDVLINTESGTANETRGGGKPIANNADCQGAETLLSQVEENNDEAYYYTREQPTSA